MLLLQCHKQELHCWGLCRMRSNKKSGTHEAGVDVAAQPHAVVHLLCHAAHQHQQQRLRNVCS